LNAEEDKFENVVNSPKPGPKTTTEDEDLLLLDAFDAGGINQFNKFRVWRNLPRLESEPSGEIVCRRHSSTQSDTSCQGDLDDLFEFALSISGGGAQTSLIIDWDFNDGTEPLTQIVPLLGGSGEAISRHQFAIGGKREVTVRADAREIARQTIDLTSSGAARRTAQGFAVLDREMTLLAGLLALGSGLLALYLSNAAWGEPKDYLQALLWGAVVAEGVKLAGALVARAWPGT
jgi:hypothetical protein